MDEKLSRDINTGYRLLGIYQVAGGLIGYVLLLLMIASLSLMSIMSLFILIAAVFLFGYSTFCGAMLLRKRKAGIQHSLINQYLQLVHVGVGGYAYKFAAGAHVFTGYEHPFNYTFAAGLSNFEMKIGAEAQPWFVEYNLVAFVIILLLYRLKRRVEEFETRIKIDELGS